MNCNRETVKNIYKQGHKGQDCYTIIIPLIDQKVNSNGRLQDFLKKNYQKFTTNFYNKLLK